MSDPQHDEQNLTTPAPSKALSKRSEALILASAAIEAQPPDELDYLHASFAHVALPRSKPSGTTFTRRFGSALIHMSSGVLIRQGQTIEQPLPYGIRPRQFLIYATTTALKRNTREIELGHSMKELMLDKLGYKSVGGGKRGVQTSLKQQLYSLVACRMTLGWHERGRDITEKCEIFTRLDDPTQWYTDQQGTLWPATATLSSDYLNSIKAHAFPVDPRAIGALDSALAIDIYCWLALRLHKLPKPLYLHWASVRDQFGQDYSNSKDFKKAFELAMRDALMVYPAAKVESVDGGLMLKPSPSPIAPTRIALSPPKP